MLFAPVRLGNTALSAEVLTADVKNCKHFGPCGVGEKALYLNGFLFDRHYYVALSSVRRVFKRVAMSQGGFSGKGAFGSIPYLVVQYDDGQEKQCTFKREEDVDELLAYLGQVHPEIPRLSVGGEQRLAKKAQQEASRYLKELTPQAQSAREELERADAKLSPTARETMYQQKFHLYRNLTKPSERLYLSFAKAGASGEAQNPSYLINEIRKLFPEIPVRDIEKEEKPEEKLEMPRSGEALFLEELGRAAEGEIDPLFEELYRWYAAHPEAGIPAETYRKAAFLRCADGVIGKSAASALYGDTLKNSATRLEKYAACAFAHFMEFGLQIRERDQYELKAADMGTVMHEALEKFSKKLQENGETWKTVTDDTRDRLIEECVEETMADYGNTIFQSSSRNQYRIIRVKRILKRTVWALQQQIRQGEFEPGEFEVSFSMEDSLSAINIDLSEHEKMRLRGRIDRVDLCETDDKVYVKIIDYKTGNTSLDLVALYYGLQLQLAVYLDAAVELEQKKHPGKQVEPAGVFYYHIDDPMLDQEEDETDEAWGRRMLKALRMDGLVNADRKVVELLDRVLEDGTTSDVIPVGKKKDGSYTSYSKVASPEQFDVIRTYTRKKVREIGEGIFSGNVKISPYQRDGATACAYCEYQGICGFDQKIQGYEYRKLKGMDTELLMKAMQEITQSDQKE